MSKAEQIARQKHHARQRLGHKMPEWEGLSEFMREELINRELDARNEPSFAETIQPLMDMMEDYLPEQAYDERHQITAAPKLTILDDEYAGLIAASLAPRITDKVVIEIGGGFGLLACHLGLYAKKVFCIEVNPIWSWLFLMTLYTHKPQNVSFLFGAADEFADLIHGDVALFCTHSGVAAMTETAQRFAPTVIDFYGEVIGGNPGKFDPWRERCALSARRSAGFD